MNLPMLENEKLRLELVININNAYYYKVYIKDTMDYIGNCGIRCNDDFYLGNIEYEIFPEYQGKGYASECTKLLMEVARCYHKESVVITANPDNLASIKTINNLGGKFIEVVKVPRKCKLYKNGDRVLARYEVNTKER